MNVKVSKYNVYFNHVNKNFVYNTLSTALIELDKDTYDCLKKESIEKINPDYIDSMKNMHFLTELNSCEENEFFYFFDSIRFKQASDVLSVTFIPTYNCNLACPYCMQGQEKKSDSMDDASLNAILIFIEEYLQTHKNVNKLAISLFGGEPMLNKNLLFKFCDNSYEIAKKNNCETFFSMTSNMTLLDEKILEYMKKYQIHTQVSIDGTAEQHDKKRIFKNGKGSYDLIVNNLEKLYAFGLKDLITIRLNIDSTNIEDSESIMHVFAKYSNDVYFGFIDTFKGSNDSFGDCIPVEEYPIYITDKFTKCYKKYGFPIPKLFGKKTPCSMNSEGKFFIDNKLNVYKCEMLLKREDCKVGSITKSGKFLPNSGYFNQMTFSPSLNEQCRTCVLLPMCGGGCPAKKYIDQGCKDGNLHLCNCLFSENQLLTYLKNFIDNKE